MRTFISRSHAASAEPEQTPSLSELSRKRIGTRLQTLIEPVFEVEPSERIAELLLLLGSDLPRPDHAADVS